MGDAGVPGLHAVLVQAIVEVRRLALLGVGDRLGDLVRIAHIVQGHGAAHGLHAEQVAALGRGPMVHEGQHG